MKKSILQLSFLIATFLTVNTFVAQQAIALTQGAEISFDKSTHDYGQIEKSANGECVFVFTNTGNQPLNITNAKGSCGCTVPSWRKKDGSSTWAPGESGEIRVRYDTKRVGVINKSVTIQSNAVNSDNITRAKKDSEGKIIGGTSTIRIKGEVKAPKVNATPMKPSQGPVNSTE